MNTIHSPGEAVELCKRYYTLGKELLSTSSGDKARVVELGKSIIDILNVWRGGIKAKHVFPELLKSLESTTIKDYEAHVELLSYGVELLEEALGEEGVEEIIGS